MGPKTFSLILFSIFSFSFAFGQAQDHDAAIKAAMSEAAKTNEYNADDLTPTFAGVSETGSASTCDLGEAKGLVLVEENDWELNSRYTLSVKGQDKTVKVPYPGRELNQEAKALIKALNPGDTLEIIDIEGENIYGVAVPVATVTINVTQCE